MLKQRKKILRKRKLICPKCLCQIKKEKINAGLDAVYKIFDGLWYITLLTLKKFMALSKRFKGFNK